ncbi:hypothetical protein [Treponema sp. TIM-1]
MRKLVLILIAFIAVAVFIRAYDNPEHNSISEHLQNGVSGRERF